MCCGAISPNLLSVRPHELVWASLSLIPLANLVVVRGGYVWSETWIGQDPGVCGRLVGLSHGWVSAMTEPSLDGEVCVGKAYNLCSVYNPFERYVSSVWAGYGVDISTS